MKLYILKNPDPQTLLEKVYAETCPARFEPSTEESAAAWVSAQLAAGWKPAPTPPPALEVPATVAAWRIKAVIKLGGHETAILAALAALPEPARTVVSAAWAQGNVFERNSRTVVAIGRAAGLSPAQLDALFIQAAALEV